jgi:AbiU2
MAEMKSPEQVRDDYRGAMGDELGTLFYALWNELAWFDAKWQQYCQLYAESQKRVELLNASASFFFRVVQDALWEDVILSIARLTGPIRSLGKDNLTLLRLPALVAEGAVVVALHSAIDHATDAAAFAKDWRNRRLAHRDLALALETGVQPLSPVSRTNVRAALAAMQKVFDVLHAHYFGSPIAWELFSVHGDANALVHWLASTRMAEERRFKRLREGKPLADDFEEPDEV